MTQAEGNPSEYPHTSVPPEAHQFQDPPLQAQLAGQVQALEARLAESERTIAVLSQRVKLLDNVHDAIVGIDPEFVINYWNHAAETLYGWPAEKALGRSVKEVLHCGLDGTQIDDVMQKLQYRNGHPEELLRLELQQRGKNGRVLDVEAAVMALHTPGGELTGYVAIVQDVSERNRLFENLSKEKHVLQAVLDTAPVGIIVTDAAGTFTLANSATREFFGGPVTGDVYHPMEGYALYQPDGQPFPPNELPLPRTLRDGAAQQNVEVVVRQKSGREVILLVSTTPLRSSRGKVWGATAVLQNITERKQAEALLLERNLALRHSEKQMRELLESISDGFFSLDRDWRVIYINNVAAEQGGYHASELTGKTIWEAVPAVVGSHLETIYRQVMQERQVVTTEFNSARSGRWFQLRVYPSAAGISIFSLDITQRKKTEKALQESQALLQARAHELETILDAVPAYMWITHDGQSHEMRGNPLLVELLQAGPGENLSKTAPQPGKLRPSKNMQDGKEIPDQELPVQRVARTGVPLRDYEFDMVFDDGQMLHLLGNVSPLFDESGRTAGAVSAFIDITPLKIYQRKLQESENRFRVTLASAPISVYTTDQKQRITWMHEQHPDFRPENVLGLRLDELLPNEYGRQIVAIQQTVLESGQALQGEIETWLDGEQSFYTYYIDPVRDETGSITGLACAGYDITRLKQVEHSLAIHAQELERSNQALQEFAFVASHDLQEPLRKIKMFGSQLRARLGESADETAGDELERMTKAAERMQAMIQGLLHLSQASTKPVQFEAVDLSQVAAEVLSDLEARLQAAGGQVILGSLPVVEGDALQLRQLFQNLIGNALKFHRPGEAPQVKVWAEQETRESGRGRRLAFIRIYVEDNGIGFDPDRASEIFQPFIRLHGKNRYEGSGIGLAICRKIVERHGGTIRADSQPGRGSTFTVVLPLTQDVH